MTKDLFHLLYQKSRVSFGSSWLGKNLKHRLIKLRLQRFQKAHWPKQPVERSIEYGITVIVPCYNHADYLEATFACLAQQTYRPFEVVFVEDHSTDHTWTSLNQRYKHLPAGITSSIIRTPKNSGQAHAINTGISHTNASLIMILNDDDYLMHDALEAAVQILAHHPDIFLLGATSRVFQGHGCPPSDEGSKLIRDIYADYTSIPLVKYTPIDALQFTHPNNINMTHTGSVFFKEAWQFVGGYYSKKSERIVIYSDRDFQMRMAALFPVAISLEVPFAYWRSDSSVDRGLNS